MTDSDVLRIAKELQDRPELLDFMREAMTATPEDRAAVLAELQKLRRIRADPL